ncbi:MAG: carbamoyl phosphate synthase preATP-grasp domain-containing protein [Thermoanaerobaculaceae bacterium]
MTLAKLLAADPGQVVGLRALSGVSRVFRKVDSCAGEFAASTPYFYKSFGEADEAQTTEDPKVVVLGSGPVRIGQGIEFDACCVHAVAGVREERHAVMVNCNPETVSTVFRGWIRFWARRCVVLER